MSYASTPLVDCHTHTSFSDGHTTFKENVQAALAAGCRVLVSTDHLTLPASMDPTCEVSVAETELDAHHTAWEQARAIAHTLSGQGTTNTQLEMVYGFECDWYQGCEPYVAHWSTAATVRLGSVHWIGNPGDITAGAAHPGKPDDPALSVAYAGTAENEAGWIDDTVDQHLWQQLGPDEVWRRYVTTWCSACESPLNFDVMAHPDLAQRFSKTGFAASINLEPLWDKMVCCAHDTGRRIEISTASFRKGLDDYYPAQGLLERFCHAGVPITFSSDAHRAEDVCDGIRMAQRHAYEVGYRTFDIPHADGSWETVPLT